MPTDPKWRTIARKSGQRVGDVIAVFNFIMVSASANASERGTIGDGFDYEDVATALDLDDAAVKAIVSAMQGKVLDGLKLCGWEKRQPKREDSSAERAKAWREERKRTQANASELPETDTEEETEKKNKIPPKGGYAFEGRVIKLKRRDLDQWRKAYPDLDLPARLQSRDDWLAFEGTDKDRERWFMSTSNWLANQQQKAAAEVRQPAWDGMP
jgi:hypothetical protein